MPSIATFNRSPSSCSFRATGALNRALKEKAMMAPYPPKDDASNLGAFLKSGSGLSSVTGLSSSSSSKRMEDAKHLSKATTQATLAAKSILSAGGNDDAALKVAKAAAQATLLHACIGKPAFTSNKGGPATFLSRRKIKRQSEIVASMALVQATNELYNNAPEDSVQEMRIQKMNIAVDPDEKANMMAKPSPLTVGTIPRPLSPLAEVNSPLNSDVNDDKENDSTDGQDTDDDDAESKASQTSKVSRLSMSSAPRENEVMMKKLQVPETIKSEEEHKSNEETIDDSVEKKASSTSEASLKPKSKPLDKGALSLDSNENTNVEVVKEVSDDDEDETKENSSPKETPTLVVAPSPSSKASPSPKARRPKPQLKLRITATRTGEPQDVASPMNSVKENLLRKKSLPSSVFTPSNTYFTEGMESREEFKRRYNRAPRNVTTPGPIASPVRVSYVRSPRSEMQRDEEDAATFASEPIYIVEREDKIDEEEVDEDDELNESQGNMNEAMYSSCSSVDSSLFSSPSDASETYETMPTHENKMDPIVSLFASMLKCGAGFHNMNKETLPDEDSVRNALKNSQIIVNTTVEDQDESASIMNRWEPKSPAVPPKSPSILSEYDPRSPRSPASRISAKFKSFRSANTPKSSRTIRDGGTPRSSKSRTPNARASTRANLFGTDESKSQTTDHTKSIDESGSSGIVYTGTESRSRSSGASRSSKSRSSGSKRRSSKRPKQQQAGWKRALGLKPTKSKQHRRSGPPRERRVQQPRFPATIEPTPSETGFESVF